MTKRSDLKRSLRFNGVFVNEDLTQVRSKLLFEARRSVKCNRLLGAWSSDGRILVKIRNAVEAVCAVDRIRNDCSLYLLFFLVTQPLIVKTVLVYYDSVC